MKKTLKPIFLIFFLLFSVLAFANISCKVTGYLNSSFNNYNVNLFIYRDFNSENLSTTVINGKFSFEISPNSTFEWCTLLLSKDKINYNLEFFASKKDIVIKPANIQNISPNENPFSKCSFEGVFFKEFIEGYRTSKEKELSEAYTLRNKNYKNAGIQEKASIDSIVEQKENELKSYRIGYIKSHPDSYAALYFFQTDISFTSYITVDSLASIYYGFSPDLKETELGKQVDQRIKNRMSVMIGKEAPEIDLVDQDGRPHQLKDIRGRYTLLCFWASTCKPCVKNIPTLNYIDSIYAPSGLKLISVSVDNSWNNWIEAVEKYNMRWLQVLNMADSKASAINVYVLGVPQYYLIDDRGIIVYSNEQTRDTEQHAILKDKLNAIFSRNVVGLSAP